ncbi:MAG: hypothetical protein ACE5HA_07100 [Anaerolineae bacterium]
MDNTNKLSRLDFLKKGAVAVGGLAFLLGTRNALVPKEGPRRIRLPSRLRSFAGQPSVGQPGYEKRVTQLFGSARTARY